MSNLYDEIPLNADSVKN